MNFNNDDIYIYIDGRKLLFNDVLKKYYITSFVLKDITRNGVEELFSNVITTNYVNYGGNIDGSTLRLINMFLPHQIIIAKKVNALLSLNNEFIEKKLASIFKKGFNRYIRLRGESDVINLEHLFKNVDNDLDATITIPAILYYEYNYTNKNGARNTMLSIEKISKDKQFVKNFKSYFDVYLLRSLIKHELDIEERNNKNHLSDDEKIEFTKRFNKITGVKLKKEIKLDELIVTLEKNAFDDISKKKKISLENLVNSDHNIEIYKHYTYKDFKRVLTLPYVLGKDELNLTLNSSLKNDDYFYFCHLFKFNVKKGRINDTDEEFRMYFAEFLLALIYDNIFNVIEKDLDYYEKYRISLEQERLKVKEDEKLLKEEKSTILKEKSEIEIVNENLTKNNQHLIKECEELKRKLSLKEKELDSYKNLKDEVVALREEVFSNNTTENIDESKELDNIVSNYKVAYFGGHPNTVQKLRSYFHDLKHVPPESLSVDLSFTKQMDICIFDTTYNNHSNYKRFKDANVETPVIYINNGTGIYTLLGKIKEVLDK